MSIILKILTIFFVLVTQGKVFAEVPIIDTKVANRTQSSELYEEDLTKEFELDIALLEIKGDAEYGEYLSGDCIACHQIDGSYDGIPSIIGWDEESFVWAMHSYKTKYRQHPVMQMMAGRLNNDEIAALAAYFQTLE